MSYNRMELMISLASRFLEDESIVVVGTGAPCAAACWRKALCSHFMIMFEAGGIGPMLLSMLISVCDSRTFYRLPPAVCPK